eukprot:6470319-Amphidinium_carterae.1
MNGWQHVLHLLTEAVAGTLVPKQRPSWMKLGVSRPRTMLLGAYTSQGAGVSRRSHDHADLLHLIHRAAKWSGRGSPYSSIMVSKQLQARPHRDARNTGLNSLLALGSFTGGEILVESADGPLQMQLEDGTMVPAADITQKGQWVHFDASCFHEVRESTGERLSVVLFLCTGLHRLDETAWTELGVLGFDVEALRNVAAEQQRGAVEHPWNAKGFGQRRHQKLRAKDLSVGATLGLTGAEARERGSVGLNKRKKEKEKKRNK